MTITTSVPPHPAPQARYVKPQWRTTCRPSGALSLDLWFVGFATHTAGPHGGMRAAQQTNAARLLPTHTNCAGPQQPWKRPDGDSDSMSEEDI